MSKQLEILNAIVEGEAKHYQVTEEIGYKKIEKIRADSAVNHLIYRMWRRALNHWSSELPFSIEFVLDEFIESEGPGRGPLDDKVIRDTRDKIVGLYNQLRKEEQQDVEN